MLERLRRRREPVLPNTSTVRPERPFSSFAEFAAAAVANGGVSSSSIFAGGGPESVGTVSRCLQLTAQSIAAMPLRYKHELETAGRAPKWLTDPDPAYYPNGIEHAVFAAVWSIYAQGDAFLWVTSRYEDGYPRAWTVLDPVTMKVELVDGTRAYTSNHEPLRARDVLQISRNPMGGLRGTSALAAYWSNVASAAAAEAYAADVYYSTGINRVALKSKQRLNPEQAAEIQSDWVAAVGRRLGAPAILPPELDLLEAISSSPREMMLLESRDWDARQIAAAFGVPAMLLNIPVAGGLTYQNPTQLFGLWWRSELMPTAVRLQAALSRWLPRGSWVEFDPSTAVRPDIESLTATFSKLYADGAVTLDEYRAAVLDLPPLEAGDQATEIFEESGADAAMEGVSSNGNG